MFIKYLEIGLDWYSRGSGGSCAHVTESQHSNLATN